MFPFVNRGENMEVNFMYFKNWELQTLIYQLHSVVCNHVQLVETTILFRFQISNLACIDHYAIV